jgi:hypothetical protein
MPACAGIPSRLDNSPDNHEWEKYMKLRIVVALAAAVTSGFVIWVGFRNDFNIIDYERWIKDA